VTGAAIMFIFCKYLVA